MELAVEREVVTVAADLAPGIERTGLSFVGHEKGSGYESVWYVKPKPV